MSQRTDRNIPDGVYAIATALLESGKPFAAVERRLVAAGASLEAARAIIADHRRATADAGKSDGRTEMRFGALALAGGVLVIAVVGVDSVVPWLGMIVGAMSVLNGLLKQRSLYTASS